jgi:hypothetical protein
MCKLSPYDFKKLKRNHRKAKEEKGNRHHVLEKNMRDDDNLNCGCDN